NGKDEPPLMQELLYLLNKQRVKVSGKIPHDSGRIHIPGSTQTKRLPDDCELTLTIILLLKIFVELPAGFAAIVGFAPAEDIFRLAELDPTLVRGISGKVRIDVNMIEPILEALVEQIAYGTSFSAGYERHLTEAAATLVRNVLLREGLTRKML